MKEFKNGFCVSLLLVNRSMQDLSDHSLEVDFLVPLHHDLKDLGLICLVKKCKIQFQILWDLKIQSWIFLKKCTLNRALNNSV